MKKFSVLLVGLLAAAANGADLTVINNCPYEIWVEGRVGDGGPIPGKGATAYKLNQGQNIQYDMPSGGLPSTRFWAKYGCDGNGRNCQIGDSMQYWPGGGCPTNGCSAPIDSLFEATWGAAGGTTWFDTSQVDGYTFPYLLELDGDRSKCSTQANPISAAGLDVRKCPTGENLSDDGKFPNVNGHSTNSVDLRYMANGKTLGCFSPCKMLNYKYGQPDGQQPALWYCCPTPDPNNCQVGNGCVTSQECRNGPAPKTEYVNAIHKMAPGIYAYAYDDANGLNTCPAKSVTYTLTWCPPGSSYPN